MEIFFLLSYGGSVVVATILTLVGVEFFLPIIAGCYLGLIASIFIFGYAANRMLHKIRLFERLSERKADESNFQKIK
jgi:hypothetical protein